MSVSLSLHVYVRVGALPQLCWWCVSFSLDVYVSVGASPQLSLISEAAWHAHSKTAKPPSSTRKRRCSTQNQQLFISVVCTYILVHFCLFSNAFFVRGHKLLGRVHGKYYPPYSYLYPFFQSQHSPVRSTKKGNGQTSAGETRAKQSVQKTWM